MEDEETSITHVTRYYEDLYKRRQAGENSMITYVIDLAVTVQQNKAIISLPSEEEIYLTVFTMGASSSPGHNGFGGDFFRSCWNIIMSDLIASLNIVSFTECYQKIQLDSCLSNS